MDDLLTGDWIKQLEELEAITKGNVKVKRVEQQPKEEPEDPKKAYDRAMDIVRR